MERGKKKERKEEYELDEASECVSSYISKGRKNEPSSPTFSPLFCHVLSSVYLSIHLNATTRYRIRQPPFRDLGM